MNQANTKRIIKNTLLLYVRQVLILLVSLYTVRIVLETLGVEDFGVYGVVGGIVSLFAFLGGSMASATQRFFSFALGQSDTTKLKVTFTVNLVIYAVIALIALLLLETIGIWFVNEHLSLPQGRFEAAQYVYHFSVLTFVATIFTTPFIAIIIAHEDMGIYAYVSIIEALLKLLVAFLLFNISWDKLELYGILLFGVSIINAFLYIGICTVKYSECQFRKMYWNNSVLREVLSFSGWTLFGQLSTVFRNQAVTILLNQAFSPVVVTARVVASNLADKVNLFSNNFNIGLYPSIIKSYASNDKKEMFALIFNGAKITFYLMWVFALPMFLAMDTVLNVWLKSPPLEAVLFTRLALIEAMINSISLPIATAARAPGRMKFYELTLGTIQVLIFVVSWIALKMGGEAYSVFVVAIVANLIMFIVRLVIVRTLIGLPLRAFFKQVVFPVAVVGVISGLASSLIHYLLPTELLYMLVFVLLSILFSSACIYFFGLDERWREEVKRVVKKRLKLHIMGG